MVSKEKLCSIALASTSLVIVFLILISAASSAQVTRIGNGSDPAVYDNRVVWTDEGVIHVYDLTAKTDTIVNSSAASNPAIYGNKLVWHDENSGIPRLTVYDIETAARSYITKDVDSSSAPNIYGNRIVWSANYNETSFSYNVYMRDISTSTQTRITSGEYPDIYDTKITYSYDDGDGRRIFVYDIMTQEITKVPYSGDLNSPHIYGNTVIWSDIYTRMGYIALYDLVNEEVAIVTSDSTVCEDGSESGCDTGFHTSIYGDKIAYAKVSNDCLGSAGVYVYNISTAQSTQVFDYGDNVYTTPDIYEDTIVWGANGNYGGATGDNGIYLINLSDTNTSQKPVADFYSPEAETVLNGPNLNGISENEVISFFDNSTGSPAAWFWDFGDGNTSTLKNPTHAYGKIGGYTVNLTVKNAAGSDTISKYGYVLMGIEGEYASPAYFSSDVTSGYAPLTVTFLDDKDAELPNYPIWRQWDFGDGVVQTYVVDANDSATPYATHTYEKPGKYSVTLSLDNRGGKAIITKYNYITVKDPAFPDFEIPVANFNMNVTEGYAPLAVQFSDLSQNAISRAWDFENDGKIDSSDPNPVHIYTAPGTYFVNLSVTNEYGFSYRVTTINVLESSSSDDDSSSGGRSHSSGGGGGSPEPAKNIEVKELCQVFITNGKETKFDFTKNATCVVYASFDAKRTLGKTTTVAEMLKEKSALVSELPSGEVYKSFNIWVGNGGVATSKNIENSEVCFRVEKSWIQEKDIDQASISLNAYNDKKWEQLPVTLSEEDDEFLYFTAETPGFSSFAITAKAKSTDEGTEKGVNLGSETRADETDAGGEGPEAEQETGSKESVSAPGFAVIYGLAGLLAVFLYRRK